jgi:hypothetical protein
LKAKSDSTYPKRFIRAIFTLQHKDLKYLPTKGVNASDLFVHVFEEIVFVHNRIDFELDPLFQAELAKWNEVLNMSPFTATDFDIDVFVEGVTGYS